VVTEGDADSTAHGTNLGLLHAAILRVSALVLIHLDSGSREVPSADNGSHDEEGEHHHDVGSPQEHEEVVSVEGLVGGGIIVL